MANEANTLRIIERVAEDTRRDTISNNDVWNMSVKGYWMSSYRFG
jgi:hypothetical protein